MTQTEPKTDDIKTRIDTHSAIIESLKTQLKEARNQRPYGSMREGWLKTMKAVTSPFAAYNKNIQSYLKDPQLHELAKDIIKLQNFCLKILKKRDKIKELKAITKFEEKLLKLEQKVLANPAYLSERYDKSMNVKETLEESFNLKSYLHELKNKFQVQVSLSIGDTEEKALELIQQLTAELSDSK